MILNYDDIPDDEKVKPTSITEYAGLHICRYGGYSFVLVSVPVETTVEPIYACFGEFDDIEDAFEYAEALRDINVKEIAEKILMRKAKSVQHIIQFMIKIREQCNGRKHGG